MPRGNPENLVPNSEKTPQQRKEQASKAGKASGAAKRKQKSIKEAVKSLLAQKLTGAWAEDPSVQRIMDRFGLTGDDCVTALAAASILNATVAGSPQHAKLLLDIAGADDKRATLPAKVTVVFGDNSEDTEV